MQGVVLRFDATFHAFPVPEPGPRPLGRIPPGSPEPEPDLEWLDSDFGELNGPRRVVA
jgi:hypothetical protein